MILKKFKSFFVLKLIAPKSIVSNHAIHILPIFIKIIVIIQSKQGQVHTLIYLLIIIMNLVEI